jgi:hypothetical protein
MQRRIWSRWSAALVFVLVGWVSACSERDATAPGFDRPTGIIIGLDRTKRLPANGELGGAAAMDAIAARYGPASRNSSDPLERAVAEWREKKNVLSGPRASKLWSGVEYDDGDYYIWSNGESYAPAGKQAKIYDLKAEATHWDGEPIDIAVTFTFDGHEASNDAQWKIHRSNGDVLISRPLGPFGSQTNPFLGMTVFSRRGWAADAAEQVDGCDLVVDDAQTHAKAWYNGEWAPTGATMGVGVNPTGPSGTASVTYTKKKDGEAESDMNFNTYFTCPPNPSEDGDGGYGGDECIVCQQWFLPVGEDWVFEWWECSPGSPTECDGGWET